MFKSFILIISQISALIAFLTLIISCSSPKGFVPFEGLKGNPYQIEILTFNSYLINSNEIPSLSSREIYVFDEIGRKLKIQTFGKDGIPVIGDINFFYAKKGPVQFVEYLDLEGGIRSKRMLSYDKNNRLIKSESISGDKVNTMTEINYDRKKNSSRKITYRNESLMENLVYQYDKNGKVIVMTDFTKNGQQKIKLEFIYDQNGNELFSKWYNSEDQLYEFYKKYYNTKNDEILLEKYRLLNGDTVLTSSTSTEYLYDSLGNQSQVVLKTKETIYLKKLIISYPMKK